MSLQVTRQRESLIALGSGKLLLLCVAEHVTLQLRRCSESLVALDAGKRLTPCMGHLVGLKATWIWQNLPTKRTVESFLLHGCTLFSCNSSRGGDSLVALKRGVFHTWKMFGWYCRPGYCGKRMKGIYLILIDELWPTYFVHDRLLKTKNIVEQHWLGPDTILKY